MEKPLVNVSRLLIVISLAAWLNSLSQYVKPFNLSDPYQSVLFIAAALPLSGGLYLVINAPEGTFLPPRQYHQFRHQSRARDVEYLAFQAFFLFGLFSAYMWLAWAGMPFNMYEEPNFYAAIAFIFVMFGALWLVKQAHLIVTLAFFLLAPAGPRLAPRR